MPSFGVSAFGSGGPDWHWRMGCHVGAHYPGQAPVRIGDVCHRTSLDAQPSSAPEVDPHADGKVPADAFTA